MAADCPFETVVIGAGVAGLAAAGRLAPSGERIAILEARDRLGGRIHTLRLPGWPIPVEAGAEFIHGDPKELWQAVRAADLPVNEVPEDHWDLSRVPPRPLHFDRLWTTISNRLRQIPADLSFADFLTSRCTDLSADEQAQAIAYVEGFNAADSSLVSCRWLAESEQAAGQDSEARSYRIPSGYDRLIESLTQKIRRENVELRLGARVTSIRWQPGKVDVELASATGILLAPIRASRAVITLPWGVLRSNDGGPGAVRFHPDLDEKWEAARALRMGSVVKLALRFRRPFWEDPEFGVSGFFHSPAAAFPTWWSADPVHTPVLTAWAGGPAAERIAGLEADDIVREAVDSLAQMLGIDAPRIEGPLDAWHFADWKHDPFARGAYTYVVSVGKPHAPHRLAEPVEETLFFAGEATDELQQGTVAGALSSGYRAAAEINPASRFA